MSNDNFSHPGNYTNEEFNGERNIAAPQNGNYTNEEFYGERNIPAPQLGRVYTYPAYFAPTANQSHFYLNSQYYNDQMQVPYQNEGAQMDGYQNNQVQASYQNLGGQWYNQVQAPYRNEEAQWDGKSDFGNSIAPYYEDSDLKNLDEIDEFVSNEENALDEMAALSTMQNGTNFDYPNPGGTENPNALPCIQGNKTKNAPEFWFPEKQLCKCCRGYKYGCDCCMMRGEVACKFCVTVAPISADNGPSANNAPGNKQLKSEAKPFVPGGALSSIASSTPSISFEQPPYQSQGSVAGAQSGMGSSYSSAAYAQPAISARGQVQVPAYPSQSNYRSHVNPASSNLKVNTNAVPSQNGQLTRHAAEFWFPECRDCSCCSGYKHGCQCCQNGRAQACKCATLQANAILPLTQVVDAGPISSDKSTYNATFSECTCCQGFLFDCACTIAGKPQCDLHRHDSKASVNVGELRADANEWKPTY